MVMRYQDRRLFFWNFDRMIIHRYIDSPLPRMVILKSIVLLTYRFLRYTADSTKMPEAFEAFLSRRCPIIVVASWTMIDNDVSIISVWNKYKQNGRNSCILSSIDDTKSIHKTYKGNIDNGNWIEIATKSGIRCFVGLLSSNQSRLIVKTKTSAPSPLPSFSTLERICCKCGLL